jgi:hypothetical protein
MTRQTSQFKGCEVFLLLFPAGLAYQAALIHTSMH